MVTLGCKTISIDELIKCAFAVGKTEMNILKMLLEEDAITSQEISERLGKDLTTVQRSLKTLSERSLVMRHQQNLDAGGYRFSYSAIPNEQIREMIRQNLDNFREKVLERVNKL